LEKLVIEGGKKLKGEITISGAKNAVLPIMAAALLAPGKHIIENVPNLRDVRTMVRLLQTMGVKVEFGDHVLEIDVPQEHSLEAPYELVKTMRASFYVLGPLVARHGYARVSLPGGCAWGPRPVNFHLEGLRKLGAEYDIDQGYVVAHTRRLKGAYLAFDVPSVGATGNLMMAAVLAEGQTVIENAAMEPEIQQLGHYLNAMGAHIEGIGTKTLTIRGVSMLKPARIAVIPDRIEAGTFLAAAVMTGGVVCLRNVRPDHMVAVISKMEELDVKMDISEGCIRLKADGRIRPVNVITDVYPGFPTDMQAQWTALMTTADGTSTVTDTIYLDRFSHVPELNRLGANIEVDGNTAIIRGVKKLKGAKVMSTDLRASASLILAGLIAEGRTEVLRIYHIDRGYERIEVKLQQLGARIWREKTEEY
jgi:UDP-N-acetylglucosamine 1-carboxyvinyltransferase